MNQLGEWVDKTIIFLYSVLYKKLGKKGLWYKFMKKIITVFMLFLYVFVAGCSSDIPQKTVDEGLSLCEHNNGLSYIETYNYTNKVTFFCNNGSRFVFVFIRGNRETIELELIAPTPKKEISKTKKQP